MPKRYSTARGREFGEGVRAAIAGANMTSRQLADVLYWQEAKVSDVVNGKGGVSALEVATLLGACRTPAPERERLLQLFPARELEGWWQLHGRCVPVRSCTARANVAAASTLISWHTHAIPVLLRTADYTRSLLVASANVPRDELDERVLALREMQELLRDGVDCSFFVHEVALDLQVGDRDEHIAQLQHLARMANRKAIKIRVVPTAARAHAGIAGPFTLLSFPKYQPLVWLELENSSLFIEQTQAVAGYEAIVKALDAVSLDENESLDLIVSRCVRLQENDGEAPQEWACPVLTDRVGEV